MKLTTICMNKYDMCTIQYEMLSILRFTTFVSYFFSSTFLRTINPLQRSFVPVNNSLKVSFSRIRI